ncbi:carboxypeptidase regulatory-like domain-containing protein [Candidatus Ozemobacteraceae bacterium]|nr:carboxypeptidase regulatory-like domain-containing protein [Candidatus Ozemobacteraceae bacterium]
MNIFNCTLRGSGFVRSMVVGVLSVIVLVVVMAGCNSGGRSGSDGSWNGLPTVAGFEEIVEGKITDAAGQPVSGATVAFLQGETLVKSTTTGSDGTYQVLLVPGSYTVRVSQTGYASVDQAFVVSIGGSNASNMVISSTVGTLNGTIRDSKSQIGIASVSVKVVSLTTPSLQISSVQTNSEGTYRFALATGSYVVSADKTGYSSASHTVTITSNTTTSQDFFLIPNGSSLSGLVSDKEGTPLKEVLIRAVLTSGKGSPADVETGDDGKYSLYLGSGTYTLTLSKSGFGQQQVTLVVGSNDDRVMDFVLGASATIAGTVKLTTTQEALANISVEIYLNGTDAKGIATTTSSGEFAFESLSPGSYEIRLGKGSQLYGAATYTVQILVDGTLIPEEPQLYLAPKILNTGEYFFESASGTIVDSFSGAPLQYVTCDLKGYGSTITDLNGRFEFKKLIPATYELTFAKPGWETLIVSFVVNPSGTVPKINPTTLSYQMVQTQPSDVGAIAGRFVDESNGEGVSDLIVRVYRQRAETRPITVQTGVDDAGNPTYGVEDYTAWELKADSPVVSTKTASPTSGVVNTVGTFRIEHLLPTTDDEKYLVFVGIGSSFVTTQNGTLAADFSNPKQVWIVENPNNVNRRHSWSLVDVKENTTTYLQNFNLATATATP